MRMKLTLALLTVGLVLCLPTALTAKPPPTATVLVDCTDPDPTKHDSIGEALDTPAGKLTVEIRGICHEDVVISRDGVTLRGADRMTDGVRGAAPPPGGPVIYIDQADDVRLEELAVLGGNRHGVRIFRAGAVRILDSRILDQPVNGVIAANSAFLEVRDTVITGAGVSALVTGDVSNTRGSGCVFEGAEAAVNPSLSGFMLITDSAISSATLGVLSDLGGWVSLVDTDVDAPTALQALRGDIHMNGGELADGAIIAAQKSSISLTDVSQAANTSGVHDLSSDSLLRLSGTTSLIGTLVLHGFSNLWIADHATVDGDLSCRSGSDAFCADPAASVSGTSDCGQCPKP